MRILHVIDSLGLGGAERNFASTIPALTEHRHHVVYLETHSAYADGLKQAGAVVERVPAEHASELPAALSRLRQLASEADVVHTQTWRSDLLGRLAAARVAPVVITLQTPPYEPRLLASYSNVGRMKARALWATDVLLTRTATERIVAVSDYVRDLAVRHLRARPERIRVIYNAIALELIRRLPDDERARMRAELSLTASDVAIITVGKVNPDKGQRTLVEAMPELLARAPQAVLLVVGDGVIRPQLEKRAAELKLGDRVRWLGMRKDVPRLLGAADIFSLASRLEGLPLSAAEAMSASLPCVLSPIPPHRELGTRVAAIDPPGAAAMVVDRDEPALYAAALARLVDDLPLRASLGSSSRRTAESHFNVKVTAPALASVFAEAVESFLR